MLLLRAMPPVSRSRQSLGAKLVESSEATARAMEKNSHCLVLSCLVSHLTRTTERDGKVTVVPFPRFISTPPVNISAPPGSDVYLDFQGTKFSNVTWQRKGWDLPAT